MDIKTVGKSGQISLGKSLVGMNFIMEFHPGGDIVLKRALVIPANECWLHEPAMKEQLARADKWMNANPATETNLDKLEAKLVEVSRPAEIMRKCSLTLISTHFKQRFSICMSKN